MINLDVTLPQPVLFVLHTLHKASLDAFVVGGAVRDVLLNRSVKDWDFTTNASPQQIQSLFPASFYDNTFGTVGITVSQLYTHMKEQGWKLDSADLEDESWAQQIFDITTYRTETGYSDRRRPDTVIWGKTLKEDVSRRDFTVNAMALKVGSPITPLAKHDGLNGQLALSMHSSRLLVRVMLIDYFSGKTDLDQKIIRTVRDPNERFQEDALRMLRAIRLAAQLHFSIHEDTFNAIKNNSQLLKHISWERIRDELLKIIASEFPKEGIVMLHNTDMLRFIIPELLDTIGVKQAGRHEYDVWNHSLESLAHCPSTDPIVRLATLLHDIGKPATYREQGPRGVTFYGHEVVGSRIARLIAKRLRLSNKEIDRIFTMVRWHMFTYSPEMTDAAIRRFIRRVGLENINDILLLRIGDRKGGGSKATSWRLRELQERIGEQLYQPMSLKDLKINGSDLMRELNLKPGPIIGKILNALFDEVLDDTDKNAQDYLITRAKELYSQLQ